MDLLTMIVPAITAGCAAYFGSYLKKKGENLATHEDIDKLTKQMGTVTTVTKNIEARISDDYWLKQRRWEVKRDTIFEATRKFGDLEAAFSELTAVVHLTYS